MVLLGKLVRRIYNATTYPASNQHRRKKQAEKKIAQATKMTQKQADKESMQVTNSTHMQSSTAPMQSTTTKQSSTMPRTATQQPSSVPTQRPASIQHMDDPLDTAALSLFCQQLCTAAVQALGAGSSHYRRMMALDLLHCVLDVFGR